MIAGLRGLQRVRGVAGKRDDAAGGGRARASAACVILTGGGDVADPRRACGPRRPLQRAPRATPTHDTIRSLLISEVS